MEEQKNVATYAMRIDTALVIVRLVLGLVSSPRFTKHGAFSGPGLSVGMVGHVYYLVAIGEFLAALASWLAFCRAFQCCDYYDHDGRNRLGYAKNGFFAGDNGFRYPLALIGLAGSPSLFLGPGRLALVSASPLPKVSEPGPRGIANSSFGWSQETRNVGFSSGRPDAAKIDHS